MRREVLAFALTIPLGLDLYIPVPEGNPSRANESRSADSCSTTAASHATSRLPARPVTNRSARSPRRNRFPLASSDGRGAATCQR